MRIWRILAIALLSILAISFTLTTPIAGQEEITPTPTPAVYLPPTKPRIGGVDLVFLIDQSKSMRYNDPEELRVDSVRLVLEILGIDNLRFPEMEHRLGLISFTTAETTAIDLPLTSLRAGSEEAWRIKRDRINEKIQAKIIGETDFKAAFRKAKEIFEEAEPTEFQPRAKAIIVLTDGEPYPYESGITPYFEDLKEYIEDNLPIASEPRSTEGYHIWVVAMAQLTGREDWPALKRLWEQTVGVNTVELAKKEEIPEVFIELLGEIYRKPELVEEGSFFVRPYLSRAFFYVVKSRKEAKVTFYRPDESPLKEGDEDVIRHEDEKYGPLIELWEVRNPVAGYWRWEKDPKSEAIVWFDKLFSKFELTEPVGLQPPFHPVVITYKATDVDGKSVKEDPNFPLKLAATITLPDGSSEPLNMGYQGIGQLSTMQPFVVTLPGVYTLSIRGTTLGPGNEELEIFTNDKGSFTVDCLQGIMVKPVNEKPQYSQVKVMYEVRLCSGQIFSEDPNYPLILEGTVIKPDGSQVPLRLDREKGKDGIYSSQVYADQEGTYSIEMIGWGRKPDGNRIEAFRCSDEFAVYKTFPVALTILEPSSGTKLAVRTAPRIPLLWFSTLWDTVRPVTFKVQLLDEEGNPIDLTIITNTPVEKVLEVNLIDPKGVGHKDILSFNWDQEEQAFVASTNKLSTLGSYTLRVDLAAKLSKEYFPRQGTAEVTFKLYDPTERITATLVGVEALIGLALVALALREVWMRTNPVQGSLVFFEAGRRLETIPISRGRRVVTIKWKELDRNYSSLGLGKVRVRSAPQLGEEKEIYLSIWNAEGEQLLAEERLASGALIYLTHSLQVRYEA